VGSVQAEETVEAPKMEFSEDHPGDLILCPKCYRVGAYRVARKGYLQKKIYVFFGFYPWECIFCRLTSLVRKRGVRKHRKH
jgi:hypothetical protein